MNENIGYAVNPMLGRIGKMLTCRVLVGRRVTITFECDVLFFY